MIHTVGATTPVANRVNSISESATLASSSRVKALEAAGQPIISFGAGEPNFGTPEHVVTAAAAACADTQMHKYSPPRGLPALRSAVVEKTLRDSKYVIDSSQVLVTNGGKHAVYGAFASLIDAGDEVIIPAPYWNTYPEAVKIVGGTPVSPMTDDATGFVVTTDQLDTVRTPRTKALVLCSPANPTGAVYSRKQLVEIGQWALKNKIWILADEIYEHFVYEDAEFLSLPAILPEVADQVILFNSVSKSYAMPGWRVGWMIGPPRIVEAAATLQSHTTSNVCNIAQAAAIAALTGGLQQADIARQAFDFRRNTLLRELDKIPGVRCTRPRGAFYVFPSVKDILGRSICGYQPNSSLELADLLLKEAHVAVVPGEAFGAPGYLRLSYALDESELVEGARRIVELLADLM